MHINIYIILYIHTYNLVSKFIKQLYQKLELEIFLSTIKYILLKVNFLLTCYLDSKHVWFVRSATKKWHANKENQINLENCLIKKEIELPKYYMIYNSFLFYFFLSNTTMIYWKLISHGHIEVLHLRKKWCSLVFRLSPDNVIPLLGNYSLTTIRKQQNSLKDQLTRIFFSEISEQRILNLTTIISVT